MASDGRRRGAVVLELTLPLDVTVGASLMTQSAAEICWAAATTGEGAVSKVITARNGAVWTVMINRPEVRNGFDKGTAELLAVAFRAFEQDRAAHVAVFAGAGGTVCAGADLKQMASGKRRSWRHESLGGPMGRTRLHPTEPVIAAVEGHAVAGGPELARSWDLRGADSRSTVEVYSRRWGPPLLNGGTVRLPRVVGMGRAMDRRLNGRPVPGEEAYRIGLVTRLVPDDTVLLAAEDLAFSIAQFPQMALRYDRTWAYARWGLEPAPAPTAEVAIGKAAPEAETGAGRFVRGAGRHGRFDNLGGPAA